PDGTGCNDGDMCTRDDTCHSGFCTAGPALICAATDQCHGPGTCDPATGACSNPPVPDGMPCDDANACTRQDTCQGGTCTGAEPVICTAADQCHRPGLCDPTTGMCSNPPMLHGSACNDGNVCTRTDTCEGGACTGGDDVVCAAADQCHGAGVCDPATGACSSPPLPDGTACEDGDPSTLHDACVAGICQGSAFADRDG